MCILLCSYMYTGYSQGLYIYIEKYTAHMQTVILFVILDNPVCNTAEFYVFQSYLKYSAILLHICILIPFERYSERVYVCVCVDHTRISSAAVYSPFCIPHQRFCGSDSTWDSRWSPESLCGAKKVDSTREQLSCTALYAGFYSYWMQNCTALFAVFYSFIWTFLEPLMRGFVTT